MNELKTTMSGKAHQCNPAHYNGNPEKSQWIPPEPIREFRLFEYADQNRWTDGTADYWAVDSQTACPQVVGIDHTRTRYCRIARFRRDADTSPWHGYPITLTRKNEKFPFTVLKIWERTQVLERAWITKFKKRQV
jgi:hypothetical protein